MIDNCMRHGQAVLLLSLVMASVGTGQTTSRDVEREIDTQVWIPMMAASNRFDAQAFLAVQSPDLVRVSVDRNEVYGRDRYSQEIRT
jgi:ketosteroid isomerase-like protein